MKIFYLVLFVTSIYGNPKTFNFVDNNDGTISDEVTGLMWQKIMTQVTFGQAMAQVAQCTTGGYNDWRMPTLKELFSLIRFSGQCDGDDSVTLFIDGEYFDQPLGDTSVPNGREIDAQTWANLAFNGTIMNQPDVHTSWGVNFVDGRVKNYPNDQSKYARYVRGNTLYAINEFHDNGDGTVSDSATGLMWAKYDSGHGLNWEEALGFCENFHQAGYNDWRLPTIKELNSIVDYNKGQNDAAINDTVFNITMVPDTDGNTWYPYFWTSTTLLDGSTPGDSAIYQTFGRALGVDDDGILMDAHGPGAIRSDPKSGNKSDYPSHTVGYQGDVQYVYNYVRPVRYIVTDNTDGSLTYPIIDTNVTKCYSDVGEMSCPTTGRFYGQDGNYGSISYTFALSEPNSNGGSSTGLIVGLCLGGLVILAIIGAWFWYDRRKKLAAVAGTDC